jgi:DNA (cytosine-5)-methyltransferase 1
MEYAKKTRAELISLCKEKNIKGYSTKKKDELITLLQANESKPKNEVIAPDPTQLRMVDLFAGTGAFTLAFEATNKVKCVFANDFVDASKKAYDENFSHKLTLQDINDVKVTDIPSHDILTGGFPCFVKGTLVLTNNGYKPIETVTLTDKLLTHTGKFQNIVNIQRKFDASLFNTVTPVYRPHAIIATPEHPFYVRQGVYDKPVWLPANKLSRYYFIGMHINQESIIPSIYTHALNTNKIWYSLGYYIAHPNDYTHCEHKQDFVLFEDYIRQSFIPEWIQSVPIDCINFFLQGFVNNQTTTTIYSYSSALAIQRLSLKTNKICNIQLTDTIPNEYTLTIESYQMSSVFFIQDDYAWFSILDRQSELKEPQTVYNFEVETNNSYCVENGIVHNCQPFSLAGKQLGFEDERANVFWKILKIIDKHQPSCVVLENVKNLVSHDNGKTFETITTNLKQRGYYIKHKVLNTAKITGIPQHRERIYIVCLKSKGVYDKFSLDFPEVEKQQVSAMYQKDPIPDKYYYTDASSTWDLVSTNITKSNTVYQYRRVYVRENKSNEYPTLTANMGGGGHNVPLIKDEKGIRKLTPRECFTVQGFPSTYKLPKLSDANLYKLAGNAVSVPVVRLIAERLIPLLQNPPTGEAEPREPGEPGEPDEDLSELSGIEELAIGVSESESESEA